MIVRRRIRQPDGTVRDESVDYGEPVPRMTWGEGAPMDQITGRGLATKRWRARTCDICGNSLVATGRRISDRTRYCTDRCAAVAGRRQGKERRTVTA